MTDDRLIVALDVPHAHAGLELAQTIGDAAGFYKIGLGMLCGGGLALANELKQEHGKRIFLDMKLFDIGATVEAAVRGLAQFDLDFLTVHGDPHVVSAAKQGAAGSDMKILAVTILTSLDRADLDAALIQPGDLPDLVSTRAGRAFDAGADGVIASPPRGGDDPRPARSIRPVDRDPRRASRRGCLGRSKTCRNPSTGHCRWCRSYRCGASDLAIRGPAHSGGGNPVRDFPLKSKFNHRL